LQVPRSEEKKRKKERILLVSFRIITCNLPFLLCNYLGFFPSCIILLFLNYVKTM
jgi:hypothetical protein